MLDRIGETAEARRVGGVAVLEDEAAFGLGQRPRALHHLRGGGAQAIQPRPADGTLHHHVAVVEVVAALLGGEHPGGVREDIFRRHCLSPLDGAG